MFEHLSKISPKTLLIRRPGEAGRCRYIPIIPIPGIKTAGEWMPLNLTNYTTSTRIPNPSILLLWSGRIPLSVITVWIL